MNRRLDPRVAWGLLLVLAGGLLLLQNFGVLGAAVSVVWIALMLAASLFFWYTFFNNRANWWALIPAVILLAISLTAILGLASPTLAEIWGGPLVLGGIGLSFWLVYLARRENWWAIIPGGVLMTLAFVSSLDTVFRRSDRPFETGGVFFLGLGLTFTLVGVLPNPHGRMRWAFFPAIVLLLMGLLILASAEALLNYVWPIALILVGLYLVLRTLGRRRTSE